jgi:hypothetical protein
MDEFGILFVAINDGGYPVLTTQFAGGSLATLIARLGRQCQLIAHDNSPIKFNLAFTPPGMTIRASERG